MSYVCPSDGKVCIDDICRVSCLKIPGESQVELCDTCKQVLEDCQCLCLGCDSFPCCCDCGESPESE